MSANLLALKLLLDFNDQKVNNFIQSLTNEEILSLKEDSFENIEKYSIIPNLFIDFEKVKIVKNQAEEIIFKSSEKGIKVISLLDKNYPSNLLKIKNPPPILFAKGNIKPDAYKKSIACVGTRKPSAFGIRTVEALVPLWVDEGFAIISGLADGIDTESHKACLDNNGTTVAVLAHGLDSIYPKSQEKLADRILNNNGLIMSEYPIGINPQKRNFVQRNRIVSGISEALIVFESTIRSGTMHTVDFAKSQNRPIFCPVPVYDLEVIEGVRKILKDGTAIPINTINDYFVVLNELGYNSSRSFKMDREILAPKSERICNIIQESTKEFSKEMIKGRMSLKDYNIALNEELYDSFYNILQESKLTVEEVLNSFLLAVVNKHKKLREERAVENEQ
ncbi:DNA-processing protein DprA [Desulfosporosinus burensis]